MYNTLLINIDELLLKGKNQHFFLGKLSDHIRRTLQAHHQGSFDFFRNNRRQIVESGEAFSEETVSALLKIPGMHSLFLARKIPLDFHQIMPAIIQELNSYTEGLPATFRIETKRACKSFPMDSMTISREIGAMVAKEFPQLKVQLKKPRLVIEIKVLDDGIYISTKKLKGVGGLPIGSSGHVLTLLSGGFDSPVASYLMSKRGCKQNFVFFHAYPFVGDEVKKKILDLTKVLSGFQIKPRLYIIPFGKIQKRISDHCKPGYRTLFFRKYMMDCSTILAQKLGAQGLVTGDALGQVSSQTMANMSLIDKSTPLPIFRPLVGFNKIEIIHLAQKIGTHDISIIPHDDACSLFAAKHPVTSPNLSYWESFLQEVSLEEEIRSCLMETEVYSAGARRIEKIGSGAF